MIYEWRTYEATPGKLSALQTHLEVAAGYSKNIGLESWDFGLRK
jgi:hypothetical protein